MKKPVLILLFLLFGNLVYGQTCCPYINELKVVPENPSATDSIYLITKITTPQTSPYKFFSNLIIKNDSIFLNNCYFSEYTDAITTYYDTIALGPLPHGKYVVYLTASISYTNSYDCFNVSANTNDSIYSFNVGTVNVNRIKNPGSSLLISPNPAKNYQNISISLEKPAELEITLHDMSGRLMKTIHKGKSPAGEATIEADLSSLAKGMYLYCVSIDGEKQYHKTFLH